MAERDVGNSTAHMINHVTHSIWNRSVTFLLSGLKDLSVFVG